VAWRDNLIDGALDGVPFEYRVVRNRFGRRTEVHEFPFRDDPFTEDLGKSARRFVIEAFVIGDNYASARDQLIQVCEAPGDKVFTHPYRGVFGVKVDGECEMIESDREGGMAVFTIPLVEAGLAFPAIQLLTLPNIGFLVPDFLGKLPNTRFSLLAAIGAVLQSIINGLNKASALLRKINGKIAGVLNLVDSLSGAIDSFTAALTTLINTPQALLNELVQLANSVMGLINTVVDLVPVLDITVPEPDFIGLTLEVIEDAFAFESVADAVPTPTPQSEQEAEGHATLTKVFKAATLASGTQVLASLTLDSSDQAKKVIENLDAKYDALLTEDFEPSIVESLIALKAGMVQHFSLASQSLPDIRTLRLGYPEPALVTSYRLYSTSTLDVDIIRRNGISNPAFVPANIDLEVLSDA
jgi:prophage DNA circulation protein